MKPFDRGLREPFFTQLRSGHCRPLLDALVARGLDVRLRGNYLNAYDDGQSIAKVSGSRTLPKLELHRAYLPAGLEGFRGRGTYPWIRCTTESIARFVAALPDICALALAHGKTEDKVERAFIDANADGTPLVCLDRQIKQSGIGHKLDVVAVMEQPRRFVVVEIKVGGDNRIQRVPRQTLDYMELMDPDGTGLRVDVAASYRRVARQLLDLGLHAPDPGWIEPGMPVLGLVLLHRNNPRSKLLARAHAQARMLPRPIYLWQTEEDLRVPVLGRWTRMGS